MTSPRHNHFLSQLPDAEIEQLLPQLQLVSLTQGQVLLEIGEVPQFGYFPVGAVISVMCELDDAYTVETNVVGRSSMFPLSNHGVESFNRAVVRHTGLAYRMRLDAFIQARRTSPFFLEALRMAVLNAFRQLHFAIACGKRHSVEQQLVRWMLVSMDHSGSNTISATHAELASILGFRREVITLTLGKLVAKTCITISRGEITVCDKYTLERHACECYWLAKGQHRPVFTALLEAS